MRPKELLHTVKACAIFPLWFPLAFKAMRKESFAMDCAAWGKWQGISTSYFSICKLFVSQKQFRNLFYWRLGAMRIFIDWLMPGYDHLQLTTNSSNVRGGFLIQHGFATIVSAHSIGRNVKVYQQVTIGYNHKLEAPIIGDNVEICCGAKIIGGIKVGNNVVVGANAVVVKDVPDNCIVAGVPARVIKMVPAPEGGSISGC